VSDRDLLITGGDLATLDPATGEISPKQTS
jgi:hypothetical protein